jgi:hypothetical protein
MGNGAPCFGARVEPTGSNKIDVLIDLNCKIREMEMLDCTKLDEYLLTCNTSWKGIISGSTSKRSRHSHSHDNSKRSSQRTNTTVLDSMRSYTPQPLSSQSQHNRSGTDLFLDCFHYHLVTSNTIVSEKLTKLLNRGSEMRGCSIVFVMMRYILLLRKKPIKFVSIVCTYILMRLVFTD